MFYINVKDATISTPDAIDSSDRTLDISPEELSCDYDLQGRLGWGSAAFIRPDNPFSPGLETERRAALYG